MATSDKPVFKPPKKRVAKKDGNTAPARVHCYDIITKTSNEDLKVKFQNDSIAVSDASKDTNPKESGEKAPRKKILKASPLKTINDGEQCDFSTDDSTLERSTIPEDNTTELTALNQSSRQPQDSPSISFDRSDTDIETVTEKSALNDEKCAQSYVTMTGTIKRGRKAGQSVDVRINMSREELEDLEAAIISKTPEAKKKTWSLQSGIHVLLFSILCMPLVMLVSSVYSFYLGTLTWYNVYLFFSEERTIWHRICVCPFLMLLYPFFIVTAAVGLGLYATLIQLAWNFDNWKAEVQDYEKGFYGFLCSSLGLDDCSPYEVVILNDQLQLEIGEPAVSKVQVADTAL